MPKISVLISSYNHEKYVGEAIQSVLDQTFRDFEIIIVDDGSTDNTVSEIQKFSDPRIHFTDLKNNHGISIAYNKAFQMSTGEFIAGLGSDDVFVPEKLEKQLEFLESHQEIAAVYSNAQLIDENGNQFKNKDHFYFSAFKGSNRSRYEWLNYFFYHGNCLCHPSILCRREAYGSVEVYDPRIHQIQDLDFYIKFSKKYEMHILQERLVKYRIRDHNLNASGSRGDTAIRSVYEYIQLLRHYTDLKIDDFVKIFPNHPFGPDLESKFIPYYVAKLAMELSTSPAHYYFAYDQLFKLFEDRNIVAELEARYNFKYKDLIQLAGERDVFQIHSPILLRSKQIIQNNLIKRLSELESSNRPIVIWGAGSAGRKTLAYIQRNNLDITKFIDADSLKWGTILENKVVYSPNILNNDKDVKPFVVIGSSYFEDIEKQLVQWGYSEGVDYHLGAFL